MVSINTNCFLILCITFPQAVLLQAHWPHPRNDHFALAKAAALITREYLSKSSNTIVIIERHLDDVMHAINNRVVEHILDSIQDTIAVQLFNGQSENHPWEYHILVVDSFEAFNEIRWNFPRTLYERNFRFLIILTRFTSDYMRTLTRIFTSCHRFHVVNANIILDHTLHGVSMYKYNLFTKEKCHQVQPYLFFRFKDKLSGLTNIFPQKLLNFHGCSLRVTSRMNPPFLTFSGNKSNPVYEKDWKSFSGLEGELLKLVAEYLNFTINLIPFPKGLSYFINYTGFGCFADLIEGRADIAAGAFSASDPKRLVLTPSDVYHMSPVVFIIRGGREMDPLLRLATPFKLKVWIILTVLLLYGVVLIWFLRCASPKFQKFVVGRENGSPMTDYFAVFLGYPMTHLPLRNFARYLLLIWLLMSLVLRNAYQGSLFDSFRMDRFQQIPEGYADLMKFKYKILVSQFFEDTETFRNNETIPMKGGHNCRLKRLENSRGRYATVTLQEFFMSYMENNYRNGSKLMMIKEPVFVFSAALFFAKHSIYAPPIKKYMRLFNDAGITGYLSKKAFKDYSIFRDSSKRTVRLEPINCYRLLGVFQIWGVMLMISVVVFVLEIASARSSKLQTYLDLIN